MTKEKVELTFETILNEYPEYDIGAEPYTIEVVNGNEKRVAKTFLDKLENVDTQDSLRLAYLDIKGTEKEMELATLAAEYLFENMDSEEVFEHFAKNELRVCQWVSDMSKEVYYHFFGILVSDDNYKGRNLNKKFLQWVIRDTDYNEGTRRTYLTDMVFAKDNLYNFDKTTN